MRLRRPDLETVGWIAAAAGWMAMALVYAWAYSPAWGAASDRTVGSGIAALKAVDYSAARNIFSRLARSGNARAETWLGYMDENGLGAPPNGTQAILWYRKAIAAGSPEAARQLGELYLKGNVVLQDTAKAKQLVQQAAGQGDLIAARDLGEMYALGIGTAKDPVQAYVWLDIAAGHGDWRAGRERDKLLTVLGSEAIRHAEDLARNTAQSISAKHQFVEGNAALPFKAAPRLLRVN